MAQKSNGKNTNFFVWEDRPETCKQSAARPAGKGIILFLNLLKDEIRV